MRVLYIARALLLDWLRSKTGVFFTLLFPIMLMVIMSSVFSDTSRIDLYVQNLDIKDGRETELSRAFIDALYSTNLFSIKPLDPSTDASTISRAGKNIRLLIIPAGFEESMQESISYRSVAVSTLPEGYGEYMRDGVSDDSNYTQVRKSSSIILIVYSDDRVYEQVKGVVESVTSRFQQRVLGVDDIINVEVRDANNGYRLADYYLASMLAAFVMINGVVGVSSIVADFKRRGILKRFITTPLRRLEWIVANMIAQSTLAMLLASMMIITAYIIFSTSIPNLTSMLILAVGALCFTGLGMLIAGILKDIEAVSGASNALALPMMFLSGAFWPLEMMPDYMQHIAKTLPLTYFIDALISSMYAELVITLERSLALIVLTVAFVGAGSMLTQWKSR